MGTAGDRGGDIPYLLMSAGEVRTLIVLNKST